MVFGLFTARGKIIVKQVYWGEVSEWERGSERTSDFDVWAPKMTTSSMLGRHWTEFLWLETVLSTFLQISYHLPLFIMTSYDMIWFQVWIWFEHPRVCTSYVCHFNDNTLPVNIITVH